jgi:hypothetical protein
MRFSNEAVQPLHRLANYRIVLLFLLPLLMTCASILAITWHMPLQVAVLSIVIAGLAWRIFLDIPFEFSYGADDTVLFRSVRKSLTVRLCDIRHGKRFGSRGYLKLRHGNGTLFLPESINGTQELLHKIQLAAQARNAS